MQPINRSFVFKSLAATLAVGAFAVMATIAVESGIPAGPTAGVVASCSGNCATGNATATAPTTMQVGVTVGPEPITTTSAAAGH